MSKQSSPCGDGLHLLRHGHELEDVAVQVFEIDAAATVPVIELAVIEAPGGAAVCESRLLDALEDGVELGVVNVEGVVVTAERNVVVEQERPAVVHPNRREMAAFCIERQTEDVSEEPGGTVEPPENPPSSYRVRTSVQRACAWLRM